MTKYLQFLAYGLAVLALSVRAAEPPTTHARSTSAQSSKKQAHASFTSNGFQCDEASKEKAVITDGASTECELLGHDNPRLAKIIGDETWFANVCPVILADSITSETDCLRANVPVLNTDDVMQVNRFGKAYTLTIRNHLTGQFTVSNLPLTPGPSPKNIAWLQGSDGTHFYYVYFVNEASGNDLLKHYKVEVFYKDPNDPDDGYLCSSHMPDSGSAPSRDCKGGTKQGNTGGGTEPPPGNK